MKSRAVGIDAKLYVGDNKTPIDLISFSVNPWENDVWYPRGIEWQAKCYATDLPALPLPHTTCNLTVTKQVRMWGFPQHKFFQWEETDTAFCQKYGIGKWIDIEEVVSALQAQVISGEYDHLGTYSLKLYSGPPGPAVTKKPIREWI